MSSILKYNQIGHIWNVFSYIFLLISCSNIWKIKDKWVVIVINCFYNSFSRLCRANWKIVSCRKQRVLFSLKFILSIIPIKNNNLHIWTVVSIDSFIWEENTFFSFTLIKCHQINFLIGLTDSKWIWWYFFQQLSISRLFSFAASEDKAETLIEEKITNGSYVMNINHNGLSLDCRPRTISIKHFPMHFVLLQSHI